MTLHFNFLDLDDSLKDDFDDSTLDKLDDTDEEDDVTDEDDLGDIIDSDVEEYTDSSKEDLLPKLVLVREHDGHHVVGLVTLTLVSVSRALPLINHLTLGLGSNGALLLVHGAALLVELGRALLMDGLLDSPGQVNALHLGDRVALGHHDGEGLGHIITWIF